MPLWAILYVISMVASAVFTIYISRRFSPVYIAGELASGLFSATFFLIYYGLVPYPHSVLTPLFMLLFILFQEIWVNRELYDMLSLKNFPKSTHGFMLIAVPLLSVSYIGPLVWIVSQVFKHYLLPV
ncbi:MAG: hypothetical protein DSZ05_04220 [Sulfurospirillum sp.]|nr:MAG: hypothetical protein DSZ05_04220 [Sulfurospirillum sp.]